MAGGCVGYFSVNFSNTGFTLTVLEGGNYSYSNLNMLFTGGPSITGASFLGYSGSFFDPTYGMNESNLLPTVTFTGNSIDVLWNTNDDSQATQFRFSDQGVGVGTASFAYATSSTVPEPSSIALLAAGLMGIVLARQRRANV